MYALVTASDERMFDRLGASVCPRGWAGKGVPNKPAEVHLLQASGASPMRHADGGPG